VPTSRRRSPAPARRRASGRPRRDPPMDARRVAGRRVGLRRWGLTSGHVGLRCRPAGAGEAPRRAPCARCTKELRSTRSLDLGVPVLAHGARRKRRSALGIELMQVGQIQGAQTGDSACLVCSVQGVAANIAPRATRAARPRGSRPTDALNAKRGERRPAGNAWVAAPTRRAVAEGRRPAASEPRTMPARQDRPISPAPPGRLPRPTRSVPPPSARAAG
jgi:hypothetical protein